MLTAIFGALISPVRAGDSLAESTGTNAPVTQPAAAGTDTNSVSASTNDTTASAASASTAQSTNRPLIAVGAMQLRDGFRLQLAAAEPDVINPVALAFDAAGRLFVAEEDLPGNLGRIKLLEDADGDGRFEQTKIYADNVLSPTAMICYGDGLFVASGRQIIFLADTDGDGAADVRRDVFGGFTPNGKSDHPAITHLVWGLDNRIHAACDGMGGNISSLTTSSTETFALTGYDFAFNPRTLALQREAGGNSSGLGFDVAGRRFTCSPTQPLQFTLTNPFLAAQNPLYFWPQLTTNLAASNWKLFPLQPNYAASSGTEKAASRFATNRFARPTSLLVYRGGAFPNTFVNDVFISDPELRLITRQSLRENGIMPLLERPASERTSDFLTSAAPDFRPVQIIAAPDGTLCIADLGRVNLHQPGQRGRIWRILPTALKPGKVPDLKKLSAPELIDSLRSPNAWVRDTAARLLFERDDDETIRNTASKLRWSGAPIARLHLVHLLAAENALDETLLMQALRDREEVVRENAVMLAANYVQDGHLPPALLRQLSFKANDVSPRVRYQLALALGSVDYSSVPGTLTTALLRSPDVPLLQAAVLTAVHNDAAPVFSQLVGQSRVGRTDTSWSFLRQLAWMSGLQNNAGLTDVLPALRDSGLGIPDQLTLARDLGEGLSARGRTFVGGPQTDQWRAFANRALVVALGNNTPAARAEAIRFLGVSGYNLQEAGEWILALLVPGEPEEVQLAAVDALAHFGDPRVTSAFVQRWPQLYNATQNAIIVRLLERFDRTLALVGAIESGQIPARALSESQINFLRSHLERSTAARAGQIYGPLLAGNLAANFATAARLKGSSETGRLIYQQRCAGCHRFKDEGREFGPDLDLATDRTREQLLSDILDPHRQIKPGYETKVVQRTNNQLLYGLVQPSGDDYLVIRQANGQRVILPRTQVDDTYAQAWSLMPLNTAAGLSVADLAGLLSFLQPAPAAP